MAQNVAAVALASRCRANKFYKAALEASPDYVAAAGLRAKLLTAQRDLPAVPAVAAPVDADADLDAWLDQVVAAEAAEQVRGVKYRAIQARLIWCDRTVESVATTETDDHLARLHESLMGIMGKVSAVVDRLDGAYTPQEVINQGVGDAWKQLPPLRAEYDALRQAQEWVVAGEPLVTSVRSDYLLDDPMASDLILSNLDVLFPAWKSRPGNVSRMSAAPEEDPRPWPADPIEQLVWLCVSEAQVWVPTMSQLNQLNTQRRLNTEQKVGV